MGDSAVTGSNSLKVAAVNDSEAGRGETPTFKHIAPRIDLDSYQAELPEYVPLYIPNGKGNISVDFKSLIQLITYLFLTGSKANNSTKLIGSECVFNESKSNSKAVEGINMDFFFVIFLKNPS